MSQERYKWQPLPERPPTTKYGIWQAKLAELADNFSACYEYDYEYGESKSLAESERKLIEHIAGRPEGELRPAYRPPHLDQP
jgi:hypothetical protein